MRAGWSKPRLFWSAVTTVVALDLVTKIVAASALRPRGLPHDVIGSTLRLTLVYNPGAAFGLFLGPMSRWIFLALTIAVLGILRVLYVATGPADRARVLALGLVCGGAVGNMVDRIRSAQGVVDFIDVGFRELRWPTFNVADTAVSVGAILLACVLWGEDRHADAPPVAEVQRGTGG